MSNGMSGHQQPYRGKSDTWLTPPEILKRLGRFDLDPCCPSKIPWSTAQTMLHVEGLEADWFGRVWLNPPYGPETGKWLAKLADHGDGIALIFARTETEMFFQHVWPKASGLLFIKGRLHFHDISGQRAKFNSGAPSVLVAFGIDNSHALQTSGIDGAFVRLKQE
jgi:hypothetical protein